MFNKGKILTALFIGFTTLGASGCIMIEDDGGRPGVIYGDGRRDPPRRSAPPWWENDPQGANCQHPDARGSTSDSPYCRQAYERDARRSSDLKRRGY